MSYENFPDAENPREPEVVKKGNSGRNILTAILVIALLATWGYIIFDKNKTRQEKQDLTTQIVNSDSAKMSCSANWMMPLCVWMHLKQVM